MTKKVLFIERQSDGLLSIEKVFREIAAKLSPDKYDSAFQRLPFGNRLGGVVRNLIFFRHGHADVFHVTGHIHYIALLLPPDRTLLTVHDLRFLYNRNRLKRYVLKKLFLDLPIKRLKYVTAVSRATQEEIVRYTACPADKIRLIDNPLQNYLVPGNKQPFRENCPTILQVGTMENKNLPNLARALEGMDCRLRIIGKLDDRQRRALDKSKISYENESDLNDTEMRKAYESADIVTFCSTYEGFGLPIIEAQALSTPVVASDISPLREVSGGAACLVDPHDPSAIRAGIFKVISDATYRQELVRSGLVNVRRFDPRLIAVRYENLYDEILTNLP